MAVSESFLENRGDADPKRVTILGSTGSVGCNTLDILGGEPDAYDVVALTAYRNVDLLARQAKSVGARRAVIGEADLYADLKQALSGSGIEAAAGDQALIEAAGEQADWVMAGIVGAAGLATTMAAVEQGAVVALANKESLVCAGDLVLQAVRKSGATLLPADSEHNAIYQVFDFDRPEAVEKIILTASGGPFLNFERKDMADVTPAQAIAHPNWDMGVKISVDSATMMNKGLELIEAWYLFPVTADQIDILIHPESVVHSLVAYRDGSTLAQLGAPDMRTPIAYTLAWPGRIETQAPRLDLAKTATLSFHEPDSSRFPALRLAREALRQGNALPTVMNAANEVAVEGFLNSKIGFLQIAELTERVMHRLSGATASDLAAVLSIDDEARRVADEMIG